MEFQLTEQQKEIRESLKKFVQNEIIPIAQKYDEEEIFPKDIMQKAHELGFLNTCIPEKFGGFGFSALDSVMISEEIAYGCMGINTSLMANDLALLPIMIAGSDEQKEKFLKPFMDEFKIASFCLTEPSNGSDAAGIKTTFKEEGDDIVVNGSKMWITNGGHAHQFTVYGSFDLDKRHKSLGALVIDPKSEGVEIGKKEDKMGHRSSDTRSIQFNNVRVPKKNLLGKPGDGWKIAMKTLDHSRPLVASSALGGAQRALDLSIQYAGEREQFGTPIKNHQMVQAMIADMAIKVESSRLLVYKAASLLDQGESNTLVASMAKAHAADSCMEVATDAVQIYGGYGYSKEYPVEKLMRDAKLIQIYEGTSQIQKMIIARELFSS